MGAFFKQPDIRAQRTPRIRRERKRIQKKKPEGSFSASSAKSLHLLRSAVPAMDDLNDLAYFAHVAEHGGFAAAAEIRIYQK